jgi:hypothetical protein
LKNQVLVLDQKPKEHPRGIIANVNQEEVPEE